MQHRERRIVGARCRDVDIRNASEVGGIKHYMLVGMGRIRIQLLRWREQRGDNMSHGTELGHPISDKAFSETAQRLHEDEAQRVGNILGRNQTTLEQWGPRREQW